MICILGERLVSLFIVKIFWLVWGSRLKCMEWVLLSEVLRWVVLMGFMLLMRLVIVMLGVVSFFM